MEAGARVWIEDKDGDDVWILAEIKTRTDSTINGFYVSDPSKVFCRHRIITSVSSTFDNNDRIQLKYQGVELANTSLSEKEKREGKDNDMITLPHLHEPAILHAIGERFGRGEIYTWTGPVLIAVNPFQKLSLYSNVSNFTSYK
jgi:myosin heavy subunit